jgi:hypothetical protein
MFVPPVCLPAWNDSAPTLRIYMKLYEDWSPIRTKFGEDRKQVPVSPVRLRNSCKSLNSSDKAYSSSHSDVALVLTIP